MWDFSTEPEFQAKLDWMDTFVRNEVEPLDHLTHQAEHVIYAPLSPELATIVRPLQQEVREHGLWACHLGPELGGQGYGQVKLALINEIWAEQPGVQLFSDVKHPTPVTPRSWPSSAQRNRNGATCNPCWMVRSSRPSR
jgi:alkylation response protein AidB-like acyl-CoA dehydrogenase